MTGVVTAVATSSLVAMEALAWLDADPNRQKGEFVLAQYLLVPHIPYADELAVLAGTVHAAQGRLAALPSAQGAPGAAHAQPRQRVGHLREPLRHRPLDLDHHEPPARVLIGGTLPMVSPEQDKVLNTTMVNVALPTIRDVFSVGESEAVVAVTDNERKLVGMVSIGDLARQEEHKAGAALKDIAQPS